MEHNHTPFAPEAAADEPVSPLNPDAAGSAPGIAFDPVPLRYRDDGLTPEKQREYVEALADTGLVNAAAARIGVSPQAINRARRRADARSFDLACAAAQRYGARRLQAIAWERAIEGTVRRHYYHGELVSEEVVYDNRLLIYLLGKTEHLLDEPDDEARAVCANWEPYMDALEQGRLAPAPEAAEAPESEPEPEPPLDDEVWEDEGRLLTNVPPPPRFAGFELGRLGSEAYMRELTEAEEEIWAERGDDEAFAVEFERRDDDRVWYLTQGSFSPMEAEPSETSAPSDPPRNGDGNHAQHGGGVGPRPGAAGSEDRVEQPEDHEQDDHDGGENDEADDT